MIPRKDFNNNITFFYFAILTVTQKFKKERKTNYCKVKILNQKINRKEEFSVQSFAFYKCFNFGTSPKVPFEYISSNCSSNF